MRTADLTDLSDLISGWFRSTTETEHIDAPERLEFSSEAAVSAVDAVTRVYPDAKWVADGSHGRIVAGELLVSLAIPLADPEAESLAWIDGAQRLGNGSVWSGCTGHLRISER